MNKWRGDYSSDIREFAFLPRIDGDIHTYTELWSIVGAQRAKRKRDWVEVEIGIPEGWWREGPPGYKMHLVEEAENSMIQLLQRNKCDIKDTKLMSDWARIKREYFASRGQ